MRRGNKRGKKGSGQMRKNRWCKPREENREEGKMKNELEGCGLNAQMLGVSTVRIATNP